MAALNQSKSIELISCIVFHFLAIWLSFGLCVLVCPCASFLVGFFRPPGDGLHRAQSRGMEAPGKGPRREGAQEKATEGGSQERTQKDIQGIKGSYQIITYRV